MSKETKHTQENIMDKIKSEGIVMKPRLYFVLKSTGAVFGGMLVFGVLLYITSFILFALRINGILALPSFGLSGAVLLFSSLPWLLIGLSVALILILEVLSRNFAFVYRQPVFYSVLAIIVMVGGISFVVDQTPFHPRIATFVEERGVPGGREFYRELGRQQVQNISSGVVREIRAGELVIESIRGETWTVATSSNTRFPREDKIKVGDHIVVIGKKNTPSMFVEAKGIRIFDSENTFEQLLDKRKVERRQGLRQ